MKMKELKKLFMLLVVLVTTTAFASCGDDKADGGSTVVSGLKVTQSSLTFNKDGGEQTLNAQAPVQVSASSDQNWCTATAGTMSGNLKVTPIVVRVAAMTTETNDRTANITVQAGSESVVVTIVQKCGDMLTVPQTDYEIAAEGGTFTVKVVSNGDYQVSTEAGWLTVGTRDAEGQSFTAAANIAGPRKATVTFTLNKEIAIVNILQAAGQQGTITATAMDIAKQMYPAWNLGNTMEGGNNAHNFTNLGGVAAETSWQSTKTSQQIIDFVKSQGFKSIRIPTAWIMGHVDNEQNLNIDPAWMARVHEIVDYCINDGLYVLLNDHWDGGWLENSFSDVSPATIKKKSEQLSKIWTQIANEFRDYDEHLLFAGLNEPGMNGNFDAAAADALLQYEQAFIDAVRATGGNNTKRILVVQSPLTSIDLAIDPAVNFDINRLNDPSGKDRLMIEVHCYDPYVFALMDEDASWGKVRYYWGTGNGSGDRYYPNGENELKNQFKKMYDNFYSKGWPAILGECGANYRFSGDAAHEASLKAWYKTITAAAINNGCIPFYWDTNYTGFNNMTIINRASLKVQNQFMLDGIKEGLAEAQWPN